MKEFNQLKNEFSVLLEKGATEAKNLGYDVQAKKLQETKKYFDNKELLVVTVGEAKRGKSSLLEALIEEPGLFPIDVNVCTNIVTIVRYGVTEKITAIVDEVDDEGNVTERQISITRKQIPEYASEKYNKDNEKNVRCLNIEVPNEKLKRGLVFVDTPGVGSLNIAHAEVTYGFLPDADVVLFVSDASAPLTETELKFLETVHKHCKNIIFPITKIDKFSDYDAVEADNRNKISKQIGIDENKVIIIPISNASKQMYLKTKDEKMYNESNFKVLEKLIWQTITDKRADILITPFLATMANEINGIKNDLQIKYKALSAGDDASKKIMDKLNQEIENRKKLQSENAKWRSIISTELNKLSTQINNNNIVQLQQELNEYISTELPVGGMANPRVSKAKRDDILNKVNSEIVKTIFDIKQILMDGTTELCMKINNEISLNMYVDDELIKGIEFTPEDTIVLRKPKLPTMDKAMTIGRMFSFGMAGGGAFGSIAGAVVGGAIGLLGGGPAGVLVGSKIGAGIGTVFGGAKGLGDATRTINGETVGDIRTALTGYIGRALSSIRGMVTNVTLELNSQIPLNFQEQLNEKIAQSLKTSNEIEESLKLAKDDIESKRAELKNHATTIVDIEQQLVSIAKEIKM